MKKMGPGPSRRTRGQALVEFALVLPVLAVLLMGGAQVGALLYGQITLDTAARDGARAASQQPNQSQAFSNGSPLAEAELATAISRTDVKSTLHVASLSSAISTGQTILLVNSTMNGAQELTASGNVAASVGAVDVPVQSFTARYAYPVNSLALAAHKCSSSDYTSTDSSQNTACQAVYKSLGFLSSPTTTVTTYIAPFCSTTNVTLSGTYSVPTCTTGSAPCSSTSVQKGQVLVAVSYDVPLFVPFFDQLLKTPGSSSHADVVLVSNRVVPCTLNEGT